MIKYIIFFSVLAISWNANADEAINNVCDDYYKKMKSIPHDSVNIEYDIQFDTPNNKQYEGCSAVIKTKWSLVGKDFDQSTILELPGWKQGKFIADSPGASLYEMVNNNMFCLVGYKFSSYMDEKENRLVTGDNLKMYAQCAIK